MKIKRTSKNKAHPSCCHLEAIERLRLGKYLRVQGRSVYLKNKNVSFYVALKPIAHVEPYGLGMLRFMYNLNYHKQMCYEYVNHLT